MTNNGVVLQITYQGGDGNDIALLQLSSGAPSVTGVQKLGDGSFQINGAGYPSAVYNIEATEDLTPPADWRPIGTVTADGAGQISFTDTDAPNFPRRFYRFTLP
jgi:hypothetical protein